ncbi:MAG TPA: MaoC family dehydratase N-terminal domain-containing protein [Acidimicrobiia bacterium]
MVDKAALGAEGEPFVLEVEAGKIREYARAIRSEHPAYLDDDRPVMPAHFLTTTFLWEGDDGNPWPRVQMSPARGMHAEQEYVFHGPPPRAGTRLTCRSRIEEIYEKQGTRGGTLTFVVMTTEFRDDSGALVAEARMTAVETARAPDERAGEGR